MNVKQTFTFFENASETGDSPICAVPNFCDTLILEVSDTAASTFKMTIGGIVDSTTTTFTALQATNLSTGAVSADIEAVGIYSIPISGMASIHANIVSATSPVAAMSLTTATPTLILPATVMGLLHLDIQKKSDE